MKNRTAVWFLLYLAGLVAVLVGLIYMGRRSIGPPTPLSPLPRITASCAFAGTFGNSPGGGPQVILKKMQTSGKVFGSSIYVPASLDLKLKGTLALIATGDITIQGKIRINRLKGSSRTHPKHLIVHSQSGRILVGAQSEIGYGEAKGGAYLLANESGPDNYQGGRGCSGGVVLLKAPQINIRGKIHGENGGGGGSVKVGYSSGRGKSEDALGASGPGGHGGDVILCAEEIISISGHVTGGRGGANGGVSTYGHQQYNAWAVGGRSHNGGDVKIVGYNPAHPASMTVPKGGKVSGGHGGGSDWRGGTAKAFCIGSRPGQGVPPGRATAQQGRAGDGGTVLFKNVNFDNPPGGTISAGISGRCYESNARGLDAFKPGEPGGDAFAYGGKGGTPGAIPAIPVRGSLMPGEPGIAFGGSDARARAGAGNPSGKGYANAGASSSGVKGAVKTSPVVNKPNAPSRPKLIARGGKSP